jgi:flagellar FliL protein
MADDDDKKEEEEEAEARGGGKKKLIIIIVPVVLILVAAAYFLFLKPKSDPGAPEELAEPTPGAVVTLDPITVNLAGSHFLKLGMAIQPTASAKEVSGSKALDLAINEFSGMTIDQLSESEGRNAAKEELVARVKLSYLPEGAKSTAELKRLGLTLDPGKVTTKIKLPSQISGGAAIKKARGLTIQPDVYEVFFTEFVMQ